ncbi:MAG: dihydroorotase [Desulfobacterales bacterium]|nr:dihydroorotase [Desulfobacterales bacterium]
MSDHTDLLLQNGRIIDPANGIDATGDLCIIDGRIGARGAQSGNNIRVIDCTGKWIVPGLIDMHVHLREPGDEYKETIASGTRAAAAGGFTAVACMPNTLPVNDNQSITRFILEKALEAGAARVYPVGAISKGSRGKSLAEFGEMKEAGAVAVSDDGLPVTNSQLMRRAMEYASNFGLLVISHAEDPFLSRNGSMNEGFLSTKLGLDGIPGPAEEVMIYRDLALAEFTGQPIHIAHISTRESVSLVRRAKARGCRVTAETTPHYFTLTEEAVDNYNTNAKMNPPLRTAMDRDAIIEGLADGAIDAVATDHAPHSCLEKEVEFERAANGIIGLETAVPLALALVRQKHLAPARMVELMSVNPARILNVAGGSLAQGMAADVTVIDPEARFLYSEDQVVSRSKNSPFLNQTLTGRAILTIMDGRISFNAM